MPWTYTIDPEQRRARVHLWGHVRGRECLVITEALLADARWQPGFDELWDTRDLEGYLMDADELESISRQEIDNRARIGAGRIATVIPDPVKRPIPALKPKLLRGYIAGESAQSGFCPRDWLITPDLDEAIAFLDRRAAPSP